MAEVVRPGPVPDEDSAPFWQGLREHRVTLQKCSNCSEIRFPPMPGCPRCGSVECAVLSAGGSGRVYSWIVVHRRIGAITEDELPCVIATVELAEGCRVLGRLETGDAVHIDLPVTAFFIDHADWTELAFTPAGG